MRALPRRATAMRSTAERAALREADELIARLGPVPASGTLPPGAALGQQPAQQPQPELPAATPSSRCAYS